MSREDFKSFIPAKKIIPELTIKAVLVGAILAVMVLSFLGMQLTVLEPVISYTTATIVLSIVISSISVFFFQGLEMKDRMRL